MQSHLTQTPTPPSPTTWPTTHTHWPQPNDSSTEDEEEVLFELDEAALSQLPLHLQTNMREIHLERTQRLQRESSCAVPVRRQPRDYYTQRWFNNVVSRMSTAQEMSTARGLRHMPCSHAYTHARTDCMGWCMGQDTHVCARESYMAMTGYHHCVARRTVCCCNELYPAYRVSSRMDVSRYYGDGGGSSEEDSRGSEGGVSYQACGEHFQENREQRQEKKSHSQFCKRKSTIISAVRGQVRRSIHRMSKIFKR